MASIVHQEVHPCVGILKHNNAINTDGLGQRAFGASPKPAGYGGRYAAHSVRTNMVNK